MKSRVFHMFIGSLLILLCLLTGVKSAVAASIFDAPNVSIPKAGETVTSKYSFIAKYNQGVTKVKTFGEGWTTTKFAWTDTEDESYFSLRPLETNKGTSGVVYSNVGSFNGKELDLKITIKDWQQFSRYQGYISYSKQDISHFAQGYDFVDQEWTFVEHNTDKPVKVSGFMTINDIDGGQGVQFSKETSAAIEKIYVADADNWINYMNLAEEYKFFDVTGNSSENSDLFATFTFLYSNQSALRFKWCVDKALIGWDYENLNFEKDYAGDPGYQGAYFGYIAKKPLRTETLQPIKKNSDSDEQLVDQNTLVNRKEEQTYTITHQVPDEYEEFYYKSYEFKDILDTVFKINSAEVFDETGKNCSDLFDFTIEENKLTYSAKKAVLLKSEFYNHYYTTVIKAVILPEAELTFVNGTAQLTNVAEISIDGVKKETNETVTQVPETKLQIKKPVKRVVNKEGTNINGKETAPGDTLIYEIDQQVNELYQDIFSKYEHFSISDQLPPQVSFQSAKVLKNNKEIEAKDVTYDKNTHTVLFNGNADFLSGMSMKNEVYTLQITTKVIEELGESEEIVNNGVATINNQNQSTNKVVNQTKLQKGSITIYKSADQLSGVETNPASLKSSGGLPVEAELENSNHLIWTKQPQKDVVYQVTANKDILLPNGEIVEKRGHDYGLITTNQEGKASIENLYAGEYAFTEIEAPFGIQLSSEPVIVMLKAVSNNQKMTAAGKQENKLQEVKLTVNKVFEQKEGSFTPAEGAVFGLYHTEAFEIDKDNKIEADTLISKIEIHNGSGSCLEKLVSGQRYYVKEISTKTGYQLNQNKYHFVYTPETNDAVHEVELFENGLIINGSKKSYLLDEAESSVEAVTEESEMTPIKNFIIKENAIFKSIINKNGTEINHYDLLTNGEQVTFKGQIYLGDNQTDTSIKITDELPEGFSYKDSKIYDELGKDVTEKTSVEVKGQTVVLSVNQKYADELQRTALSWILDTVYQQSPEHEGKLFKNQMSLMLNEEMIPSNIVTLSPPKNEIKPQGSFPDTGDAARNISAIGICLILGSLFLWYKKKNMKNERV
ncbi:isopeptide-forming domain-containing fimbrial protein [Enterococcus sp. CWB-B31]|uniref:isopeptide-forming domain-containing fimbrial protein n=1 Tax=Enterococcus sp. CWB-B31 TaxID=2885159 RepID=UPI001E5D81A4|nr:isopeptide-forming domain-containing fimbrial protein [Enterococcus sp. CWB-B31]MCB5956411.1 isopeptide-forming domain-containing fimbrial protein [Enterococcus sp. CWB-B31]